MIEPLPADFLPKFLKSHAADHRGHAEVPEPAGQVG